MVSHRDYDTSNCKVSPIQAWLYLSIELIYGTAKNETATWTDSSAVFLESRVFDNRR